jgi:hypothetical protein
MSDVWDEEVERTDGESSSSIRKHQKEGYRDNLPLHEDLRTQQGFDNGFEEGLRYGRLYGKLYASLMEDLCDKTAAEHAVRLNDFNRLEDLLLQGNCLDPRSIEIGALISNFSQRSQLLVQDIVNQTE